MKDDRIPRAVFYGQLKEGSRTAGGQKLRFKDTLNPICNLVISIYPTGKAMHQTDVCGDLIATNL